MWKCSSHIFIKLRTFKRGRERERERETERGPDRAKVRHSTPSRSTSEAMVSALLMTLSTLRIRLNMTIVYSCNYIPKVSNFFYLMPLTGLLCR